MENWNLSAWTSEFERMSLHKIFCETGENWSVFHHATWDDSDGKTHLFLNSGVGCGPQNGKIFGWITWFSQRGVPRFRTDICNVYIIKEYNIYVCVWCVYICMCAIVLYYIYYVLCFMVYCRSTWDDPSLFRADVIARIGGKCLDTLWYIHTLPGKCAFIDVFPRNITIDRGDFPVPCLITREIERQVKKVETCKGAPRPVF